MHVCLSSGSKGQSSPGLDQPEEVGQRPACIHVCALTYVCVRVFGLGAVIARLIRGWERHCQDWVNSLIQPGPPPGPQTWPLWWKWPKAWEFLRVGPAACFPGARDRGLKAGALSVAVSAAGGTGGWAAPLLVSSPRSSDADVLVRARAPPPPRSMLPLFYALGWGLLLAPLSPFSD